MFCEYYYFINKKTNIYNSTFCNFYKDPGLYVQFIHFRITIYYIQPFVSFQLWLWKRNYWLLYNQGIRVSTRRIGFLLNPHDQRSWGVNRKRDTYRPNLILTLSFYLKAVDFLNLVFIQHDVTDCDIKSNSYRQ
jgi:hypothetical protein